MANATAAQAASAARDDLAAAGVENPGREAWILLAHVLNCDRALLHGHPERVVTPAQLDRMRWLTRRRADRMPLAQVTGTREFWSMELAVTADTLVPRPDSETLVAFCLEHAATAANAHVLDLGTGTGCLLIALLGAWPDCRGVGVDCRPPALEVARRNALAHGVAQRALFVAGDWHAALRARFALVVANPPYVSTAQIARLEPEVARHEPRIALDGGADGLACYRGILPGLARILESGGMAVLEHGTGQGAAVEAMARGHGLRIAGVARDLAGRRRCLALRPSADTARI